MRPIDADALMEKLNGIWDCNDMTFAPVDGCCIDADCKSCRWRETLEYVKRLVQNQTTLSSWHRVEDNGPHWVSVEERKPPEYTDVWCAVYTTDLIYVEDGETVEEAIENRQLEAARNPRVTLGSYSDDEGWTDGYFGMPMVCQPDYWLEMTIPEPPKEGK